MPLFNDPYYSSSFSHYYVPTTYSVSGRTPFSFSYMSPLSSMLSAGIGSNPVPRGMLSSRTYSPLLPSISETNSPILTRRDYSHRISPRNISGKTYFRAPRPLVINTETIDVSSRRNATTDEDDDSTAPGRIHRGRTVVRMHTKKLKENPGLRKKKTQGELLVEKFLIKEKPEPKEEPLIRRRRVWEVDDDSESPENNICRRGTIKRYTSGVRKKSGPLPDILNAVASKEIVLPRKVSVNDELLKEEAAILDCMIQEEMGRPVSEEVSAKKKKTGELLDVESISKRKTKRESRTYTTKKSSKTLPLDSLDGNQFVKKAYSKKKSSKTLPLDSVDETDNIDNGNKDLVINKKKINSDLNVLTRQRVYSRKKSPRLLPLDSVDETGVTKDNVLVEPCNLKLLENKMYNKRKSSKYLAVPEVLSSEDNVIKNINIQTSVGEIEKKSYNKTNSVSPKFVIDSIHVEETLSPKLPKKLINYEVIIEETTDSDIEKRKRSSENCTEGLKKIKKQSNKKGDKANIVERKKNLLSSTEDSCSSLEDTSYINKLHSKPGLEDAETLNEHHLSVFKKEVTSSEKESDCDPKLEKPIIQNISDNILSEKPKDIKYTSDEQMISSKGNCKEAENINSITECVVDNITDNCKENTICLMETNKELDRNKLFAKKVLEKAVEANKVDGKLKKNNIKVQVECDKLVKTQAKDKNVIAEDLGNVTTPQKVFRCEIDISTQLHTSGSDLFNVDIPINDKKNTLSKEEVLLEKNIPSQSDFLGNSGKKYMNKLKKQLKTEISENKFSILKGDELKSEQVPSSETVIEPKLNEQETNANVSQQINVDNKLVLSTKLENRSNENDVNVKSTTLEYDNPIEHQFLKSECNTSNIKHEGSFLKSSKKNTLTSLKEPKDLKQKILKNENCTSFESKSDKNSQTTNKETTESINKQEIIKDEVTKSVLPENSKTNDKLLTPKKIKKQFSVDDFSVKKTNTVVGNALQTDSNQLEGMILVPHSATKEEIPTEKISTPSNNQTNVTKNVKSQEEIKGELSIKRITHSKDICLGENKTSNSLSSSKMSENKDELSLIKNKKFNLTKPAGSEQPKQEAVKPTRKVNQLIKAFSSEESKVVAKQNNISEISKKDKPISFRKDIFEATKASSLDETKMCNQFTVAVNQTQDDNKSLRNDLNTESNNIDNRTESVNIPEIDQSSFSPKTKHLVKVLNIDDNLEDFSENNKELRLVTFPETCIEQLTDDDKPVSPKLGVSESSSFEKTISTSELTESKKRTLPKESETSTVLEENKSNTKAVDAFVKPITDSSVSSTDCVRSEKEFKAKETNKSDTQKTSIEEIVSDNKSEQQTLITVTSDKKVCENVDEPCNVHSCSVDSTTEGINSEEETSSEEESYEESSDEEPSGKVSFSDESSDEVGTSYTANGSRTDSGFNSPSSSLLETPACSPEGTVNNSSPS